jgi:FKBP-type peptidyl-prolyl cis-trans isomerase
VIPEPSKVGVVRKFAAIFVAAAFVVSVAACADLPAEVQGCAPTYHAGSASKAITASGAIGSQPKVHIPTPTTTTKVENSVTTEGKGLILGKGDIAEISSLLYEGKSGQLVGSTSSGVVYSKSTAVQVPVGDKSTVLPPTVTNALMCTRVGTRIVTVLSAAQVYGSSANAVSQGYGAKDTMVLVTDVGNGYRGRAVGVLQPLQSGFPSVVTAPNGTPGLTLDLQEPPKALQYEVVRGGSGAKVKAGQTVMLQVQGVEWSDPAPTKTFDSTWTDDTPRFYTLTALKANAGGQSLDKGSVKALVGQRVGSQILVVVPPKAGYPSGKAPTGYPTGSTLIFVYDILGTY